jgi:hypothetical protein
VPMAPFERKLTAPRRKAIFTARLEHNVQLKEIVRRAKTGELIPGDPFDITLEYVSRLCVQEQRRRAGRYESPLADKPHRDAVELLRRGCIGVADMIVTEMLETGRKRPKDLDPKRLQEAIKAATMAAALPAPNEDAPLAPGQTRDGKRSSGERVRGGETGALMRALRDGARNGDEGEATDGRG